MIIDWYTVIFQIINFLILVFLLRRFLYGPIVKAMEARRDEIIQREQDAEAKSSEAEERIRLYEEKREDLQRREDEIVEEAREKAEKERLRLLESSRSEVEETRERWLQELQRQQESFMQQLKLKIGRQASLVARRCLENLADAELEKMIFAVFTGKLEELPADERKRFAQAAEKGEAVSVRSSFAPSKDMLAQLEKALKKAAGKAVKLKQKEDPSLICGVELEAGGHLVAWSIDHYLNGGEKEILEHLQSQGKEGLPHDGGE